MAAGFRTIILVGFAIGGVGGVVLSDLKLNDALPTQDHRLQVSVVRDFETGGGVNQERSLAHHG